MSFPQLLMNRELGLPGARLKIEEALIRTTAKNLVEDCFHFDTIEFPQSSTHRTIRCKDFVAVLSQDKTSKKVQLALWSLVAKCKLWNLETTLTELNHDDIIVSENGMVILSTGCKMIVRDGKQLGMLPRLNWCTINPIGVRILGTWVERNGSDPLLGWLPENSSYFFGEYDQMGKPLNRYLLDYTRGRWKHAYACDENFWVRLSGSDKADLSSIIEVIDRVIGKMRTFELPLNPDEEKFSSACIVQNRLFYGKNVRVHYEPTICIFDLVKGAIIEEFPTGAETGEPTKLVANQHYAAWLEYRANSENRVQYLDIFKKTVKDATNIPYCAEDSDVNLIIDGTILSVIYTAKYLNTEWTRWRRKVIDMTTGELKWDVGYTERFPFGECSISNGNMLITDCVSDQAGMYIESFIGEGVSSKESTFRDNQE